MTRAVSTPITDSVATVMTDTVVTVAAERAEESLRSHLSRPRQLKVGPRRMPLSKVVRVVTGKPRHPVEGTDLVTLRWRPTGPFARCYPSLDGRVAVTSIDSCTSLLTVRAAYSPPFGRLGRSLDRAALHRLAQSTCDRVARDLAAVASHAPADADAGAEDGGGS